MGTRIRQIKNAYTLETNTEAKGHLKDQGIDVTIILK
jgi:hypothetical protein